MYKNVILKTLASYESDFKKFMGIDEFPTYELKMHEVSLGAATSQGFDVAASVWFEPEKKSHTLSISTNLTLSKYLMFHEYYAYH